MQCDQKCDEMREDAAMARDQREQLRKEIRDTGLTARDLATALEVIGQYEVDEAEALKAVTARSRDRSREFHAYAAAHNICAKLERGVDPESDG